MGGLVRFVVSNRDNQAVIAAPDASAAFVAAWGISPTAVRDATEVGYPDTAAAVDRIVTAGFVRIVFDYHDPDGCPIEAIVVADRTARTRMPAGVVECDGGAVWGRNGQCERGRRR